MPLSLTKKLRDLLATTTAEARVRAESACRAALENLAVHEKESRSHMSAEQRSLRKRLRSRGKALGDARDERGAQELHQLVDLAAYEHWHRLLFTRFLTENNKLITDEANGSVPVKLDDCDELAPELGARDGFELACRFASRTLPGVFRTDDPVLELPVAVNDQVELRKLLAKLPAECFQADDALGWTYQYWQAQRKEEVNKSGKKIGAAELSPVTQLFTEDYMVEFLLHNTLGAWWAGKLGPIEAATEADARARAALGPRDDVPGIAWTYLRFVQDAATKRWRPAAGTFDGWPRSAHLIRLLDPCMGSGHFLVFALPVLVRLRMEEEGLDPRAAVVAVVRDNLHGLELDERCTQIAAFNVALTAWKLAGYQPLPPPNLACSGLAPSATEAEWVALAGDNYRAQRGMARLHSLFKDAPVLGSLINPRSLSGDLVEAEFHELAPLIADALAPTDDEGIELAFVAQGLAKVAVLLAEQYTLVITNVPYLGRGKHDDVLRDFCEREHAEAKADLATCFVQRCLHLCAANCSTALVTTHQWWFSRSYSKLRESLLKEQSFCFVVTLGEEAWQSFGDRGPIAALQIATKVAPSAAQQIAGIDALPLPTIEEKIGGIQTGVVCFLGQSVQRANPDARIAFTTNGGSERLSRYCSSFLGLGTGDYSHYGRCFWELLAATDGWAFQQCTVTSPICWGGREHVLAWDRQAGRVGGMTDGERVQIHNQDQSGQQAWGRRGIAVGLMRELRATVYTGEPYEKALAVLLPTSDEMLPALWAYCIDPEFNKAVRELERNVIVASGTLVKVPFDLAHWQKVAAEKYPDGLPKPHSDDPTQWLFNGHPRGSEQPLHVAVARLLGYRWPRQTGSSFPDCPALGPDGLERFADDDGIVCLPPLNREQPAAARLRQVLTAALGSFDEQALIAKAGLKGSKSKTLEDWLRDEFFEQHAKLFHDRPFIWHLWDGRPDGFHALVHYHRLDHASLQKLTYSYLGNWIQQQAEDAKADKPGAAVRLGAAQKLQDRLAAILEGDAPLDVFVRWKPLAEQARGWHPDLDDGVRQNIRPFLLAGDVGKKGAGLFRTVPLALKDKDRGTEPERSKADYPWFWCEEAPGTDPVGGAEFVGNRWNDVHLTLARKQQAKARG